MFFVTKEFTFDMAHRLNLNYPSPCSRIHGHTYKVQLTYKHIRLDANGMVRDFSDIKKDIDIIKARFDHKILLDKRDVLSAEIDSVDGVEYFLGNPTAENMAQAIYVGLKETDSKLYSVRIYETPTSWAEYSESAVDLNTRM